MKSTGIVRKVDELGRVVIPKEIRKTSFINEGTPLEIYSGDDGEIVLKKYSLIKNLKGYSEEVAESLNSLIKGKVVIHDNNEIISSSGINIKSATNFFETQDFIHNKNGIFDYNGTTFYIKQIISSGIVIGNIIVWGINDFTQEILGAVNVMAIYLGNMAS